MYTREEGKRNFKRSDSKTFKIKPIIKNVLATTLIFSSLSFASISNVSAVQSDLETVYHVYINSNYIGTATNQSVIETVANKKVTKLKDEYGNYDYIIANDVTYVPEQVFRNTLTNDAVIASLEEELAIEVEASAVEIDGEQVVFLENEEKAEEVLKKLKLKHVSEKDLKYIEKIKKDEEKPKKLKKGETRLVDIALSKDVDIAEKVAVEPDQLLTVKEAVKLLEKGTLEEKLYEVEEGDVLGSIAEKHGLKTKQLIKLNPGIDEDTILQIGQELNVTEYEPYVDVVVSKERYEHKKTDYKKEVVEDSSMFKGDTKVKQKGKKGVKAVTYEIVEKNGKTVKKEITKEKTIKKPVKEITVKGTKVVPSRGSGSFTWPTNGGYVSSTQGYRWGSFHKGIDIARPSNRTIKAADNGVVASAGWDGGYGNKIVINHNNGYRTVYAHLASINVRPGQTVSKGSNIGVMGTTGNSTGVHLHFEVYQNGKLKNPLNYLR